MHASAATGCGSSQGAAIESRLQVPGGIMITLYNTRKFKSENRGETLFSTSFEHGLSEALYVLTTAHRSLPLIKYLSLDIDHWYPHALAHTGENILSCSLTV